jgi:hypothetical protein
LIGDSIPRLPSTPTSTTLGRQLLSVDAGPLLTAYVTRMAAAGPGRSASDLPLGETAENSDELATVCAY